MAFNITFLGTSSMVPTKDRNHSSIYLEYDGKATLIDCGEGTQRQIRLAGLKPSKIKRLLITHWHGDHTLGIPGLIITLGNSDFTGKLEIYGPEGSKEHMNQIMKAFAFECKVDFRVHEIEKDGEFYSNSKYSVEAYKLDHKVPSIGYRFIEKSKRKINKTFVTKMGIPDGPLLGKLQRGQNVEWKGKEIKVSEATKMSKGKIVGFMLDTGLCDNCKVIAKNANLFIGEATHTSSLKEKAESSKHMTAKDTAIVAKEAGAKKLILTHLSQRYKTPEKILNDAKEEFEKVIVAEDFLKVRV